MVQVGVHTMAIDSRGQHVLVLKPLGEAPGQGRLLPIWIGLPEATAILVAFEATEAPRRPLSYDLMARLLDSCRATVERVEITRIEEGTFYATITLVTPGGTHLIDARPSDSVALAVRVGAPIFVADEVLATAGMADEEGDGDQESEVAAFQEFLDQVDPEDFRG